VIQRAYGDEKPFNFSSVGTPTMFVSLTRQDGTVVDKLPIDLSAAGDTNHDLRPEDLVREVQKQLNDSTLYKNKVTVSYDTAAQKLVFTPVDSTAKVTITSEALKTAMDNAT